MVEVKLFSPIGRVIERARRRGLRYSTAVLARLTTRWVMTWPERIHDAYCFLYARVTSRPLIHVIGDSHTRVYRMARPFVVHHLGGATAHNLGKPNSTTRSYEQLFRIVKRINLRRDILLLIFGEIDCRIHIHYQYEKQEGKRTVLQLIDQTIERYGAVIQQLRYLGANVCVHGVAPAARQENIYQYPFYGSPEVRSQISRLFNQQLKQFCTRHGYPYVDIYSQVADASGFTLPEYAGDEVHLNKKARALVRQWFSNELRFRL